MDKNSTRLRRARKARAKIRQLRIPRLSVHRTPRHIYAQVFDPAGKVLATVSTVQAALKQELGATGNVAAAQAVGAQIAAAAKAAGIDRVAFDRSGFKYHGRIKALADAARQAGLQF